MLREGSKKENIKALGKHVMYININLLSGWRYITAGSALAFHMADLLSILCTPYCPSSLARSY